MPVPSLNIHTDQDAENPSVAGGSAVDPTKPGPWVTWQEIGANAPGDGKNQIFVEKPIGPGQTNCNGVKPAARRPGGSLRSAGSAGSRWASSASAAIRSLNVDRTRDGIEPDIAFTGPNDSVPWVVWYEQNASGAGLNNNEMVFAAKATAPSATTPPTGPSTAGSTGRRWAAAPGRAGRLDRRRFVRRRASPTRTRAH